MKVFFVYHDRELMTTVRSETLEGAEGRARELGYDLNGPDRVFTLAEHMQLSGLL